MKIAVTVTILISTYVFSSCADAGNAKADRGAKKHTNECFPSLFKETEKPMNKTGSVTPEASCLILLFYSVLAMLSIER
jgi:hypothetical protein